MLQPVLFIFINHKTLIFQGTLKIDPHSEEFKIMLTGGEANVFLTPHEENLAACEMNLDGKCNLGKRPIAVVGKLCIFVHKICTNYYFVLLSLTPSSSQHL